MTGNGQEILRVDGLRKLYRNGRGVRSASFSLYRGDIFGLLGSNGSGKTTAIKSICGLCAYEGEIRLFGASVADDPRRALFRAGFIVEAPAFYGSLSAERNAALAATSYGMRGAAVKDAAAWALRSVGLEKYARERAEKFSLGMKARLALALCFVSEPEFFALDEPLNGLDIEGMVEVRNIILKRAADSGATFLISSHLAGEIEKTCNRVGVMDEGELLEVARMDDVVSEYGSVEDYYIDTLRRRRGEPVAAAATGRTGAEPVKRAYAEPGKPSESEELGRPSESEKSSRSGAKSGAEPGESDAREAGL